MDKVFIDSEIVSAMRAKDKPRLSILRLVKNEIDIKEKERHEALTDDEVVGALKKVLRQTTETLEGSVKAATSDERTALLQAQVDILTAYLPKQVTGDELQTIVDRIMADGGFTQKRDMGRAIGVVVAETGGNCDKAEVARMVGAKLS